MTVLIDSDTHLFEPTDMWQRYADPSDRATALRMEPDELGYYWLLHGDRRITLGLPHRPRDVEGVGAFRQRWRRGLQADFDYQGFTASYSDPRARLEHLDEIGYQASVMFPNYGIAWERPLKGDLHATLVNMAAWNRWILDVAAEGAGRLHPVAHLSLRDLGWLEGQLEKLAAGGIRLALLAPALVDGKRMSDPSIERAWSAFEDHGVTPCFHVANQPRPFDEVWYGEELEAGITPMSVAFLWTAAALALTDLIYNGVLERHPGLRFGIMELSARWVPQHLQMMDGGYRFTGMFNGEAVPLSIMPSEYFTRQVRVAAFANERPDDLTRQVGDIFMACSDYPHTEGTLTPNDDYEATGVTPSERPGFFRDNAAFLLRL